MNYAYLMGYGSNYTALWNQDKHALKEDNSIATKTLGVKKCNKCGRELKEDDNVCENCGKEYIEENKGYIKNSLYF